MNSITKIKEIFASIQGEGPYVGAKQLFIRFCGCNLHCNYCDTEFSGNDNFVEYSSQSLFEKIKQFDLSTINSFSLTGGEPLLSADFLKDFLPVLKQNKQKIYLETNATLYQELLKVIDFIDIISADIKLESATGNKDLAILHDLFFEACKEKEVFAKIVFDKNITDIEIENCVNLAKKHDFELILQPKMNGDVMSVNADFCVEILDKFLNKYSRVRLIPQVHKFLSVQ